MMFNDIDLDVIIGLVFHHLRAGTQHSRASTRVLSTHFNAFFQVRILVDMFILIQIVDALIGIGKIWKHVLE